MEGLSKIPLKVLQFKLKEGSSVILFPNEPSSRILNVFISSGSFFL